MTSKEKKENSQDKIQEISNLEQGLSYILMEKQHFQLELSETEAALTELKTSGEEVYRVIGQIMLKSEKNKIQEDLENKKKFLELRLKNLKDQESSLMKKIEFLRKELI